MSGRKLTLVSHDIRCCEVAGGVGLGLGSCSPICRRASNPTLAARTCCDELASRADFLLTEALKQAIAETEYSLWCEQEERRDSNLLVSPLEPNTPAARSAICTSRSTSPVKDLNTLIASVAVKRRGSEDSIRTVYRADEQLPDSAYRSRSDLRHGQSERQ